MRAMAWYGSRAQATEIISRLDALLQLMGALMASQEDLQNSVNQLADALHGFLSSAQQRADAMQAEIDSLQADPDVDNDKLSGLIDQVNGLTQEIQAAQSAAAQQTDTAEQGQAADTSAGQAASAGATEAPAPEGGTDQPAAPDQPADQPAPAEGGDAFQS